MIKVGITGSQGFVGYHLYQTLNLLKEEFSLINFERRYFEDFQNLDSFVASCDIIVHLAALNRHNDPELIYHTNILLVDKLIASLERTASKAHLIISSSTQEKHDNFYGKSKKEGRLLLSEWANQSGGSLTGLIIPNVFGPFGHPNYNSVIATFCHQIARNETPHIDVDGQLKLIYVGDLVEQIIHVIRTNDNTHEVVIPHTDEAKVSEILTLLEYFRKSYQEKGEIPVLQNDFEHKLFNTYRCYMDIGSYFPKKFVQHLDTRGGFVEIARQGIPGQTSFSTTLPDITRGNHFHTRKIERFAVIKGKALIQLRRIGTNELHDFYLDGDKPAYVDMPIWYTHNIKNIGEDTLYTIFWINEPFDTNDPDTYFEIV
ncbi:MAG: SDR family oxidoreductase [Lutibacter sp.]|nr:SDR family oxidoreductase [Lutibacter sp.]